MKTRLLSAFLLLTLGTFAQNQYAWIQKASNPAVGRHRASGCASTTRGYFGLGHINNMLGEIIYSDWWEYDPGTNTWMQRADFGGGQRYHAVAAGIGNRIFAGTGSSPMGDSDDWWEYMPATNTWTQRPPVPGGVRSGAVAVECSGKAYVMLGDFQSDCEEFNPSTNTWTTKNPSIVSGYSSVGASLNNKIYVGVGSGTTWAEFDPLTNVWTAKATFPGAYRFGSGCFSFGGWVYVISGSDWATEFSDCWAYKPSTNQWVQIDDFPGQPRHYLVSFKVNNLVFCGSGTSGTNYNDFWQYGTLSGIEDQNDLNNAVHVFPNPMNDQTTIEITTGDLKDCTISLRDALGREVKHFENLSGTRMTIPRDDLDAGNYFYMITRNDQQPLTGKLIVQ